MDKWNRLLKRIIWKNLGKETTPPPEMFGLFQSISDAFDSYDKEYALLSRIMDLSSEELFDANTQLRKRNEELDRFVYSTSHDLRAPLTSIMGLLQLIDLSNNESERAKYLDQIKISTKQLDDYIHEIVSYSHNKKVELISEKIDFNQLIDKCIGRLYFMHNASRIEKVIEVKVEDDFYSDAQRLENLLSNLLSNAIKYYDPAKAIPFVKMAVSKRECGVIITVQDNGLGIEEKHLDKIFKMFYRASSKSKGSGIGLYIVKEIIDKLEGTVSVDSTFGVGTTFHISIPSRKQ